MCDSAVFPKRPVAGYRPTMSKSIGIDEDAARGHRPSGLTRRRLLAGCGVVLAGSMLGADVAAARPRRPRPIATSPLWRVAADRGLIFGTATSTRLFPDVPYSDLVDREAAMLFVEDDLLWYKLKPSPDAELDFSHADLFFERAEAERQLIIAAHLVWDEGFGDGWTEDDLWGLTPDEAHSLLFGTAEAMLTRYRGRVAGWVVANEVTDPEGDGGFRTDVPWYAALGSSYVGEMFHLARRLDPKALRVLNEFGFETTNEYGDDPVARQRATLQVIDTLLDQQVPVQALGIQAHLLAEDFAARFDRRQYRRFLAEVADRGLEIMITELDVLDDGLPADIARRDRGVADVYARYLDTALEERAVTGVLTFGLSDRHTWLQEDYPRPDGAARRPLPWDTDLVAKPAHAALRKALADAPCRRPRWRIAR